MKAKLLALLLVSGSALFAQTNFYFGFGINQAPRGNRYYAPPPPPPQARYIPRSPGYGYVWVPGSWMMVNNRYDWRNGYWNPPPRGNGNGRNNWNNGRGKGKGNGRNRG